MDPAHGTPLLDFFRRGDVDRDLRLVAAQGGLPAQPHEQLAMLAMLANDPDPEVVRTAEATLSALDANVLTAFLAQGAVTPETRAFFAARGVEPAPGAEAPPDTLIPETEPQPEEDTRTVLERLAQMTVAERVVRAMKGTREERTILIRDPNKLVSAAVLSSPKLTESEVETIARMANVSEEVLRTIGRTRGWMKNYAIVVALARNPKTPVAISMNLLQRLMDKDLKAISTDRNVPDVLRTTARRKMVSG